MNTLHNTKGGKIIGQGSYGCVFKPKLKCSKSKNKKKNKKSKKTNKFTHTENISKLFFKKKGVKEALEELEFSNNIKNIKNHEKWASIYTSMCDPGLYSDILKYEPDIKKCRGINKNEPSMMSLQGNYGGKPVSVYLVDNINIFYEEDNINKFINNYHKFLCLFKNIFKGLSDMNNHNICHLDIKYDNIVKSMTTLKLIDFGLSNNSVIDFKLIKKRGYNEFKTQRYYPPYPPEFIYNSCNNSDLEYELDIISSEGIYRHYGELLKSVHIDYFKDKPDFENYINNLIQRNIDNPLNKTELKKMHDKIDIYSLGIVFIYLFKHLNERDNFINTKVIMIFDHPKIKPFINLVKKMVKLNYYERISANDAYKEYVKILKSFNN